MIKKNKLKNLRNPEHFQFMTSANVVFGKYEVDVENLGPLYTELELCVDQEEMAMAAEIHNEKIQEKNQLDTYRDKMYSKLVNFLKAILCDENDPAYEDAVIIMKILKETGNPTSLAENAESAMILTLGNRLQPYQQQLESMGVIKTVDVLMETNQRFIKVEAECREITAEQQLNKIPAMFVLRKQTDAVYRSIVNAINGYADLPSKKEQYRELVAEMNVLVEKYDQLVLGRKNGNLPDEGM